MKAVYTEQDLNQELLSFLLKFDMLTAEEMQHIAKGIVVRFFKKGTLLVKEDDISTNCYFVLKGCLRQYVLSEGQEKTTRFYEEEQAVVLFTSYASQVKAGSYLVCVEDSVLIVGEPESETMMYKQFPKLEQITRVMMEQDFGKTQDDLSHFIISSPEERYLHLLQNSPGLLQRVPQHQLASYIGVTPESLSRIRKRIARTGKPA
jgi:CRP-like cAMP-binding protein